jgi:hypothetical protein
MCPLVIQALLCAAAAAATSHVVDNFTSTVHNASFAAMANTCNLPEINVAALKVFNADLEARAAATKAPTTAQTFEPTAAPESDAAGRPTLGAVAVALVALVV